MNRYPLWKYISVAVALVIGLLYALPNFYGEAPAVQVSSARATLKITARTQEEVEDILANVNVPHIGVFPDENGIKVRFESEELQIKAKDALEASLNPDPQDQQYVIALNLLSSSPAWLRSLNALPMYLGLDLRGGVHFLLQVDMKGAIEKRLDSTAADIRTLMRDERIRHAGVAREGNKLRIRFRKAENRESARYAILDNQTDIELTESELDGKFILGVAFKESAIQGIQQSALKQNITTLHKRVNELGVAEPVVQQQGADRIVVQLPGIQDVASAKSLIGRTATLEVRMVESPDVTPESSPFGTDVVPERTRDGGLRHVAVKKTVVLTGDHFEDAQATFDEQQRPAVAVNLDATGGRIMRDLTRENLQKLMSILLVEKGKAEAISVATIQGEFSNRFQITGNFTTEETNTLAILIRAGSIAAPMEIVEERVIGPSLGADNIRRGFNSTLWGVAAIAVFMCLYYLLFGMVSVCALAANLLFLFSLLSMLQATLTLPGIAAIALTLGMAIDANVLINERIREELRNGSTAQAAIAGGYERAFDTILDSNITTLIAGLALLTFGSGPVRGFAVVHCLGILTSIFSAVVVSRSMVNLIYGRRKKLDKLSIGQVWKPTAPEGRQTGARRTADNAN